MIPLNWASIQWGRVPSMKFGGYPGTTVTFVSWKTPPTSLDGVRVIITPNNTRLPESVTPNHPAAPVAVIDEVNPSGFVFHAVNVDGLDGEAGFDWMAVEEMSGPQLGHEASLDVRFGIGQPRTLGHGGAIGDWAAYTASFGRPFSTGTQDELIRLLTAHNFGETAVSALAVDATQAEQDAKFQITSGGVARNTIAAVGITCEQFSNPMRGMAYIARSADDVDGKVGFKLACALRRRGQPRRDDRHRRDGILAPVLQDDPEPGLLGVPHRRLRSPVRQPADRARHRCPTPRHARTLPAAAGRRRRHRFQHHAVRLHDRRPQHRHRPRPDSVLLGSDRMRRRMRRRMTAE